MTTDRTTDRPNIREGLVSSFALGLPTDLENGDRRDVLRVVLGEAPPEFLREALGLVRSSIEDAPGIDAEEELSSTADDVVRRQYYGHVRQCAEEIEEEGRERIRKGETADDVREWADERAHEDADGSYWTIYTHANFRALLASSNWTAAEEEGLLESAEGDLGRMLAISTYCALRADIVESLPDWDDVEEETEDAKDSAVEDVRDALGMVREDEDEALTELREGLDEDAAGLLLSRLAPDGFGRDAVRVLLGLGEGEPFPEGVLRAEAEARADGCSCPSVWSGHGDPKPDPKRPDPDCPIHRAEE